jgi:hypothetical protein
MDVASSRTSAGPPEAARLHVAERAAAHHRGDVVQRPTDPAQAHGHRDHREHEADRQDRRGPAQADAQGPLAPGRERLALLGQPLPEHIGLAGDRAAVTLPRGAASAWSSARNVA